MPKGARRGSREGADADGAGGPQPRRQAPEGAVLGESQRGRAGLRCWRIAVRHTKSRIDELIRHFFDEF